jgi:DNA-binding HxlR family transcriptional regulator
VELIGRRWTGVVVRAMLAGAARYSDIRAAVPDLSDKMLAERLKELEAEGVVTRAVVPSTPVRVEYHLTEKGRALDAAVAAVAAWAEAWLPAAPGACDAARGDSLGGGASGGAAASAAGAPRARRRAPRAR